MNTANFEQTGGYPLETGSLTFLQTAFGIFSAMAGLAGSMTIVSGCEETGNNVGDGVVAIEGQLYRFKGSVKTSSVKIFSEVINRGFQNGQSKPVFTNRWVGFGSGVDSMPWSDFKRLKMIKEIQRALVPIDTITMYGGTLNDIPEGWFICDGTNETSDLRSKFIVGLNPDEDDYDAVGKTGGEKEVTLTKGQMPTHKHSGRTTLGNHSHEYEDTLYIDQYNRGITKGVDNVMTFVTGGSNRNAKTDNDGSNLYGHYRRNNTSTGSHNHLLDVDTEGENQAHENRPPYYTTIFIQFKG